MIDPALVSLIGFSLIAGVTTFFSPCAYPLLPGYVGFYVNQTDGRGSSLRGSVLRGFVAGLGVLGTFAGLFGAAYWVGQNILGGLTILEPAVGVVLVVFGLLVVFDMAPSLSVALPKRPTGLTGFGIFGAGYALAAAGCVAPVFLGVVTQAMTMDVLPAMLIVASYVGIIVVLMVALTVATGVGLVANAGWIANHTKAIERLAGAVMIIAGLGQIYLALFVNTY
ncbi:cytochrome C biogenesis protein (plasmid) [Halostagnicola larsenii XH-48]|uniref:Cytochrome C biogenesis protein n=1 Tax=Halostagnicola larsenii XH-48 TaxID=797299 RepID=W0JV48_9EURY|nr:cytochrome c biogenesis protein CcdA [Halostagnicola larsenii]AHG02446.1 cytochrome C biogenesis protein [Halostagnicola larsenii XH-48]